MGRLCIKKERQQLMVKKKIVRKKSKYEDQAQIATVIVKKIDYKNQPTGKDGTLKTVFYCPSYLCPEGRMCIVYGRINFEVGDEVTMKGRFNDGVFLVWSMYKTATAQQVEERAKRTQEYVAQVRERLINGTNPETNNQSVS